MSMGNKTRQERAELQDAGQALGFSCHGPWEDPLACMDVCEACPFWQMDAPEQDPKEYYEWLNGVCEAELGREGDLEYYHATRRPEPALQ